MGGDNTNIKVVYTEDVIAERIRHLAGRIATAGLEDLLVVAILKGSFVFAADLIRLFLSRSNMSSTFPRSLEKLGTLAIDLICEMPDLLLTLNKFWKLLELTAFTEFLQQKNKSICKMHSILS